MEELRATSSSTSVAQGIKKESLFNDSSEGTRQSITTLISIPAAQATIKKLFSGECTSAKTCEIHINRVKKSSTITIETKTVWTLRAS